MTPLTPAEQAVVAANIGLAYTFGRKIAPAGSDDAASDDAVQEASIALMRAARGFKPEHGFKFSTYACNAILMQGRRHRRCHKHHLQSETDVYDSVPEDRREPAACGLELAELAAALKSLKPRLRRVIVMRFVDGMTQKQIAEVIGKGYQTVLNDQKAALATLRVRMESRWLAPKQTKEGVK